MTDKIYRSDVPHYEPVLPNASLIEMRNAIYDLADIVQNKMNGIVTDEQAHDQLEAIMNRMLDIYRHEPLVPVPWT